MTLSPDQPSRPLPAPTARVVRAEVTEAPISVTELADAVQDAAAGAVSFRFRDGAQTNGVPLDEAVAHIVRVVDDRINDPAGEKLHSD